MNNLTALFLGVLQGFTEFLPVSSSGHLVLAQEFIPGFTQPGILFDTVLHAGTLIAVVFYFRKKLLNLSKDMMLLLIIGTIPAGLAGVLFDDLFEAMFAGVAFLGIQFLVSGVMNYLVDTAKPSREKISIRDSVLIGIAQMAAIVPAISRSSATIFAGTRLGIKRQEAAEFSFLLSIPALAGAVVLQLVKYGFDSSIPFAHYTIGFVAAMITGFLSISVLLRVLVSKNFKVFAYYCFLLGIAIILLVK